MINTSQIPFPKSNLLVVSEPEAEQKLIRFLEKHTNESSSLLHKWVRTGQVRINGKRSKPFQLIQKDDEIRIPPFATCTHIQKSTAIPITSLLASTDTFGEDLRLIYYDDTIMALNKPSGLAVQPGSDVSDCVSGRLLEAFSLCSYAPAPAHRIDKYTSGIIVCGLTHASQKQLHEWFASNESLSKEYLAWISGHWPYEHETRLEDTLLKKKDHTGKELVHVVQEGGQRAVSYASCLAKQTVYIKGSVQKVSLLKIRLITGRTHQIRVQLSSRGFPVIGDTKYKGTYFSSMLLHAWKVILPDGRVLQAEPLWKAPFCYKKEKSQ